MSIKTASLLLFNSVSSVGSRIFSFACAFYILQHTDSTALFTLYLTAIVISTLVTEPLLGLFAGRYHNKMMVIMIQLLNVIFLFVFTIVFDMFFNYIIILGIMLNMTDATIRMFIDANVNHIIKGDVERYTSLTLTTNTAIHFLAPIIGGMMIAFFNIETLALLNLITEALAVLFVLNLPLDKEVKFEHKQMKKSLREGYRYLKQQKALKHFFIIMVALHFLVAVFSIGMPIAAVQSMQLSAPQYGVVVAGFTVGMVAVSVWLGMNSEKDNLKSTYERAMLLQCVTVLILGVMVVFQMNTAVAMLLLFILNGLMGLSQPLAIIPTSNYLQEAIEEKYRGYVMTFKQTLLDISYPIALLFFGVVLNHHQAVVYFIVTVLIMVLYIYFSFIMRKGFRIV
ncbi:TPA: MFS transporter [Staphylococcus pseudintermedius]|uniref:MFS transporter n=1 Tax=Staphylococcus pseudintermedius TaxID=283734 RepID=UPI000C1C777C|nr:MFS transporter [Staphylococcus pseudintermedius]EGQ0364299.1 MFS transporter [Staphylococcus pseudintermedius]EGQ1312600.1 MFS transporter [Staphylococcus pseudintermedius]EGQ1710268.1 MFS transporter [Staphylococcus pseudintermedius]EGQ1726080.1 MFS transporter [Staphylococcus pseudintermedius]EGQ2707446.1 MFS transporter [Staphylococcus pseudintermedius]